MSIQLQLIKAAKRAPAHIVLPEGEDPRIVEGAIRAANEGIARITLLGSHDEVIAAASGATIPQGKVTVTDPTTAELGNFADLLVEARKGRVGPEDAPRLAREPLNFAALMVRAGLADGTLGGAVHTTADTVRAALQIIGKLPSSSIVSSFFLMALAEGRNGGPETVVFSDCALIVEPDADQLADIAIASAASFEALTGETARVAMLSFSTMGSARHANVEKVAAATQLVREKSPDLLVDGELQFDAAFVASVAASKAPVSQVAGRANVFIFPNLDAGNIGYKIAQRIGGAEAIGPSLQGLASPANDLSRGCSADDVFNMIAVTVNQVNMRR
jgi:phosphate acetyltransferase